MEEKMKKKIALFLVAALVCAGLIISCGGDDTKKPEPAPVYYTVGFDANGGTVEGLESVFVSVKAGESVTSAKWPEDPVKSTLFDYGVVEDDFLGWFDGTTQVKATDAINKDVTLKASYAPFVRPEREDDYVTPLGWFTWTNNANQKGWRADGCDGEETDLAWEDIAEARYLVLHTKGGTGANWQTGFGEIQVVMQGDGNSWAWGGSQTNINSFYYPRGTGATDDVYIAIDLATINSYPKFAKGSVGKILIAYYNVLTNSVGLGLQEAYLTNKNLSKANSVLLSGVSDNDKTKTRTIGFATKANILGLTAPTDTKTVTFNINYAGGTNPDAAIVGTGKGISLKYPDVSRAGHDFLGWFDGNATTITNAVQEADDYDLDGIVDTWGDKYEPTTAVAADVTLKAGWKEQNWPVIANAEKTASNISQWNINESLPFKYFIIATIGGGNADGFGGTQFQFQGGGITGVMGTTGNWTSFAHTSSEIIYYIIDLSGYSSYQEALTSGQWVQFRINYGGSVLGGYQGYVVDNAVQSLTRPAGAVDFNGNDGDSTHVPVVGFITRTLPVELQ